MASAGAVCTSRSRVSGLVRSPSRCPNCAPVSPPRARPQARRRCASRRVRRAHGAATVGRRSVKIWQGHVGWSQKNFRTRRCKWTVYGPHGRAARVRGYRLCTRRVSVWHRGQRTRVRVVVTWSVSCAAVSSRCHPCTDRVIRSGMKWAKKVRIGGRTKAISSWSKGTRQATRGTCHAGRQCEFIK